MASTHEPQHYTKRPVTIEAVQFAGGRQAADEIIGWIKANGGRAVYVEARSGKPAPNCPTPEFHETHRYCPNCPFLDEPSPESLQITTLEGAMRADVGDWIIRGVQGEFYPCKPDIFDATYDLAAVVVDVNGDEHIGVLPVVEAEPAALLGYATTRELLDEIRARIEVGSVGLDYRTVDPS